MKIFILLTLICTSQLIFYPDLPAAINCGLSQTQLSLYILSFSGTYLVYSRPDRFQTKSVYFNLDRTFRIGYGLLSDRIGCDAKTLDQLKDQERWFQFGDIEGMAILQEASLDLKAQVTQNTNQIKKNSNQLNLLKNWWRLYHAYVLFAICFTFQIVFLLIMIKFRKTPIIPSEIQTPCKQKSIKQQISENIDLVKPGPVDSLVYIEPEDISVE